MSEHPEAFEGAKQYEKIALTFGSPYTCRQGEALEELASPERIGKIEEDYQERLQRERQRRRRNPLLEDGLNPEWDIDDLYGVDEGGGACLVCHK